MTNTTNPVGAIQIITTKDAPTRTVCGKPERCVSVIEKYEDGPLLRDVLCGSELGDLPAIVISVAGKTRGGKSFLLNLMAQYLEARGSKDWGNSKINSIFKWKNGDESITRGFWICSKVFQLTNSRGKDVGIVLLDNQGMFDGNLTTGETIAISGISTAISHWQMFNLKEIILTKDVEDIWMHLLPAERSEKDGRGTPNGTLMFVVRDYMGAETGTGLENGKKYLENKRNEGTAENKRMWEELGAVFQDMQCLLLPHPGSQVLEDHFTEKGRLTDLEEDFILDIKRFFDWLFHPKNLVPRVEGFTLKEMYETIKGFDNKVADESLSVLNVFSEHGNEDKLSSYIDAFKITIRNENDISKIHDIMESQQRYAKFIGKSAERYKVSFVKEMGKILNTKIKDKLISYYLKETEDGLIKKKHEKVWPWIISQMALLWGDTDEKKIFINSIIEKAAANYYKRLSNELINEFADVCKTKEIKELKGFDDRFIANSYKKCNDFKNHGDCQEDIDDIWLMERGELKAKLHNIQSLIVEKQNKSSESNTLSAVTNALLDGSKTVVATMADLFSGIVGEVGCTVAEAGMNTFGFTDMLNQARDHLQAVIFVFAILHVITIGLLLFIIFFK